MKVCDKTCIFFFFPIINKYFLMADRSLLSRCPSYIYQNNVHSYNRREEFIGNITPELIVVCTLLLSVYQTVILG